MNSQKEKMVRTFAYGSNMFSFRLRERCPSARPLGAAELHRYELRWHKRSRDQSGKCDVVATNGESSVFGVVYEIDASEKPALDLAEGLNYGYAEKDVTVMLDGKSLNVSAYLATDIDPSLQPYTWYKALVVAGAREHKLPLEYVTRIESVMAHQDPDQKRHDKNMRLVNSWKDAAGASG